MDYILVQKVNDRITPRRLTPEEAEAWYQNQKDSDDPTTILDIRESTMFGSPVLEELDMLLVVSPATVETAPSPIVRTCEHCGRSHDAFVRCPECLRRAAMERG